MCTQVAVTFPRVQPVVRPTLCTVCPTVAPPSAVILKLPEMVSEPLFAPVVRAIEPSVEVVPLAYLARAESLRRQRRPAGQPPPVVYAGSATSVAIWADPGPELGCQYGVLSLPPCTLVQCELVMKDRWVPRNALKPRVQRKPGKLI